MSCNRSFCFLLRCGQTTRLLSQNCSKSSLGAAHSKFLGNLMQIPRNSVVRRWTGSYATGNLSADEANEFVDNLSAEERENLKNALAQYDSSTRRKFEGEEEKITYSNIFSPLIIPFIYYLIIITMKRHSSQSRKNVFFYN